MRDSFNPLVSKNYSTFFSIMLSITISLTNRAYFAVVDMLTEWENHRTQTAFNDSKINKLFVVQALSSFGSLFYAAFLEEQLEGNCGMIRCMPYLTKLVSTILFQRLIFTILFDNIVPRLKAWKRFADETAGVDATTLSEAEKQSFLDPFDLNGEIISRFMDQTLMFGYMVSCAPG